MSKKIEQEIQSWLNEIPILAHLSDENYHQDCTKVIFRAKEILEKLLNKKEK